MKVLIVDKFSEGGISRLRSAGHTVIYDASLKDEALREKLAEERPQVLVVRSTRVPASHMDANLQLEMVVRAGAGYDNIDVAGASQRGIFVANCPGKNAVAVAELAFGLILALDRRIPDNVAQIREGRWNKAEFSKADGLKDRTLGLIGMGNIGREMVRRALAFDMDVAAWSRSLTDEEAERLGVERCRDPLEVAARSDFVSLHVASTPETKGLANRRFFDAMKEGAALINTSRAEIVDPDALAHSVKERGIRYGTDVPHGEPQAKVGQFRYVPADHPNVYVTHHIGASTRQAEDAIGQEAVRIVLTYAESGAVPNCVNIATHTPATHLITIRHLDKVGVLAAVLDEIRKANWNVQDMENLVFEGAVAACARITFAGEPDAEVVRRISRHGDVLAVSLLPLNQQVDT